MDNDLDKKLRSYSLELKDIRNRKNQAIIEHDYDNARKLKDLELKVEAQYDKVLFKVVKKDMIKKVDLDNVYSVISNRTKIPVNYLKGIDYDVICKRLKKTIIGQDKIIDDMFKNIKNKSYVINNRPTTLLLVGKSGVGKTFFVKEYAKLLYQDNSFIRLDMSEYVDSFSTTKIIGSPPGYVGYKENKTLVDRIKYNPYSVLLLDEIEKASPSVLKLFLQVFDEGFMTSSTGEVVNFSNVTIFMTSNLGTNRRSIGFSSEKKDFINDKIKSFLGVELYNRIDDVFIFNDIDDLIIEKIIKKKLTDIGENRKIKNFISTEIVEKIKKETNYLTMGARKLDRVVDKVLDELGILSV